MAMDQESRKPLSIGIKRLLTESLLIPAFVMQMAVGCASNSEPSSPTYLTREILPLKSPGNPDIRFIIAPRNEESAKLQTAAERKSAGSVRVRFDLDEWGTASYVETEIVGEMADPSEAGRLENAAFYLFRDNLKISATLDGRPVAAKGVVTLVHFDRVLPSQALEASAAPDEEEGAKTVGRVVLGVVGLVILIPLAVLSGGHISFGK